MGPEVGTFFGREKEREIINHYWGKVIQLETPKEYLNPLNTYLGSHTFSYQPSNKKFYSSTINQIVRF